MNTRSEVGFYNMRGKGHFKSKNNLTSTFESELASFLHVVSPIMAFASFTEVSCAVAELLQWVSSVERPSVLTELFYSEWIL